MLLYEYKQELKNDQIHAAKSSLQLTYKHLHEDLKSPFNSKSSDYIHVILQNIPEGIFEY